MIKLQFKLPQALISRGFTRRTVFHAPAFQQSLCDQTTQKIMFMSMTQVTESGNSMEKLDLIMSEVLTRRVSALLDDLSLFASRIVFLRDVSPPFSGKILMVHIVAKREGKKMVWSVFKLYQLLKMSWCKREV